MISKSTFKKKFPDVKVQRLETLGVLSKKRVEEIVIQMCQTMEFGLIYYEYCRKWITVYTSNKMKKQLASMQINAELMDKNTGEKVTVISENPFLVCGEYCVRVMFPNGKTDVYSCEYFVE